MKKKENIILLSLLIYSILGIFIGSFYDLSINIALNSPNNIFANLFKISAEIPMIILASTSCILYIKNKNVNLVTFLFLSIIAIIFPTVSSFTILSYFHITNLFYSLIILTLYIATIYLILNNIKIENQKSLIDYCLFTIITIIIIYLSFEGLKILWGRPRFYYLLEIKDLSQFKNWWILNGRPISDNFKSFPSGHTASAGTSLILIFAPKTLNIKNNKIKISLFLIPIIYIICTQLARIISGAHFLSDVSAALMLDIIIIFISSRFLLKKYIKKD